MLTRLGLAARGWVADSPWTNVYGVARTLVALGMLTTLALTPTEALFAPVRDHPPAPYCDGGRGLSLRDEGREPPAQRTLGLLVVGLHPSVSPAAAP